CAIVHDHRGANFMRTLHHVLHHTKKGCARRGLGANLNEARASGETGGGHSRHGEARPRDEVGVNDGVERRKRQTASARFFCSPGFSPVFGAKRSMKPVLSRPARKSASLRIFKCIGIVVLTPSTTDISSARRIRTIASCRSRP